MFNRTTFATIPRSKASSIDSSTGGGGSGSSGGSRVKGPLSWTRSLTSSGGKKGDLTKQRRATSIASVEVGEEAALVQTAVAPPTKVSKDERVRFCL